MVLFSGLTPSEPPYLHGFSADQSINQSINHFNSRQIEQHLLDINAGKQ
jgi:hypothetical protein